MMEKSSIDRNQQLRLWVEQWQKAAPDLAEQRRFEIQHSEVGATIEGLTDAFESAIRLTPPVPYSGLIEWERWMAIFHR